jgi:hypothetical protein
VKLWLDDIRNPPDDSWLVARTADAAIAHMKTAIAIGDPIYEASLDHDLGHCDACTGCNGYQSSCGCRCHLSGTFVVNWMATEGVWPVKVRVHSMNPVGAKNMQATLLRYGPYTEVPWVSIKYTEGQKP